MINGILSLYSPRYASTLAYMLQSSEYHIGKYLKWFWRTQNFNKVEVSSGRSRQAKLLSLTARALIGLEILIGLGFIALNIWHNLTGGWEFGAALIIGYPVVVAHLLPLVAKLSALWRAPKQAGKNFLCNILEDQVKELRRRNKFVVVAVAGSVGKTSTKLAIAQTLTVSKKVIYQDGNYNHQLTVPLIFFGQSEPSIYNLLAWKKIIFSNWRQIHKPYPYDVAVVELGADAPGQLKYFKYLRPDIFVLTAVADEHMENFKTLDAVAGEELVPLGFSKKALLNIDDVPAKYLPKNKHLTYGLQKKADYCIVKREPENLNGQKLSFQLRDKKFTADILALGEQGAKVILAAAAVADMVGLGSEQISRGLQDVKAVSGRMQILAGKKDSIIIDDTYNASPLAAIAALDVLYSAKTPQRIAILGSMNELGEHSQLAHRQVGEYCDKSKLDLVITVGGDAKKYLAPAASQAGCRVKSFDSPYLAGNFAREQLKKDAVVLAKGSQNGVFAEEALKVLLEDPADEAKLVRQSKYWMKLKSRSFSKS